MASHDTIDLTIDGGAARILLNRPDALNAWNEQFGHDLLDAVETVSADESVRAAMIIGAGRGFSSGADLKENRSDGDGLPDLSKRLKELYHPIIVGIREAPKPFVAAVNGPAVGIGCSLALACDLIVAAESSYMLLAFVNIGLVPDGGSTAFIPARTGYRVVPDDALDSEASALLEKLASGPTKSYAGAKKLLNRRIYADLQGQLDAEADAQREQGLSKDFIEGVMAFVEKRPANFTGA
jgi:2-(1,2-epoxy-1,2-dihydrophenyl)acetyl-CoA isomerase